MNGEQQWTFTSEEGEISVSVLKDSQTPAVSSYKGAEPRATVVIEPGIKAEDKDVLDAVFHSEVPSSPPPCGVVRPSLCCRALRQRAVLRH